MISVKVYSGAMSSKPESIRMLRLTELGISEEMIMLVSITSRIMPSHLIYFHCVRVWTFLQVLKSRQHPFQ